MHIRLPMLLLLALLTACKSTPDAPPTGRTFQTGTIGIICRKASERGSVDAPGKPAEEFLRGMAGNVRSTVGALDGAGEVSNRNPLAAYAFGIPLGLTAAAAPVTGLVRAVATLPGQTSAQTVGQLERRLAGVIGADMAAAQLAAAAQQAGIPVVMSVSTTGESSAGSTAAQCAGLKQRGAATLVDVTVFGPSLALSGEYSSLACMVVAMRVSLFDASSGSPRKSFWVSQSVEPGRTLNSWSAHPETLLDATGQAMSDAVREFTRLLSVEGGQGEVVRRYQGSTRRSPVAALWTDD